MSTMSRLALVAVALSVASPVAAQAVPNFSGTWVLSADKSDFGAMPAPASRTDVIDHKDPALIIQRKISSPNGDANLTLTYGIDGKPYKNTTPQGDVSSTLKWEGKELVITSTVDTPNGAAGITDRLSLSADGKTMTQKRIISIQGQEINQTIVLVKQ